MKQHFASAAVPFEIKDVLGYCWAITEHTQLNKFTSRFMCGTIQNVRLLL